MLFRTVYGPELEALYDHLLHAPEGLNRIQIIEAFAPRVHGTQAVTSPQNVDDALSFLLSSYLLNEQQGLFTATETGLPFRLALLQNLRKLETTQLVPLHPLDSQYSGLLTQTFAQPNLLYADELHLRFNCLDSVRALGGMSKEKVQAWKRVMEFLGVGFRAGQGFVHVFSAELLLLALDQLPIGETPLQQVIETLFDRFVCSTNGVGDLAPALRVPLLHLASVGIVRLRPAQDSPLRAYLHPHNYRYFQRVRTHDLA